MGAIAKLAIVMAEYYSEKRLIHILEESDHEILQEIGKEALDENGFPNWVKLADVNYIIELSTSYSFQEWAELAKAIFNIENMVEFAKNEMYEMFEEFIRLFDIKVKIKTDPNDLV